MQGEESVKEDIDLEQLMGEWFRTCDENETFQALRQHYKRNQSTNTKLVLPFSSERKFSGVVFEGEGTYLMGAYQFISHRQIRQCLKRLQNMQVRVFVC